MTLDPDQLTAIWRKLLQTASGRRWLEQVGLPGWLLLIVSFLQLICGWFLLFTIVLLPRGVRWIISGITFRPYRESLRKRLIRRQVEMEIYPACAIIRGPTGAALVLGSASPIDLETLTDLAGVFGEIYTAQSVGPGSRAVQALLRDDEYQENRRRRVPPQNSLGHSLWLFDVFLDLKECGEFEGQPILALGVLPEPDGIHLQVPWEPFSAELRQRKQRHRMSGTDSPGDLEFNEEPVETPTMGRKDSARENDAGLFRTEAPAETSDDELFANLFHSVEVEKSRDADPDGDLWERSSEEFPREESTNEQPRISVRHRATPRLERTEGGAALAVLSQVFARAADVAATGALGLLLSMLFPSLSPWLLAAFLAGAALLLGLSWTLAVRHALANQNRPLLLVVFPWTFVRYSIRHWPQTCPALNLLALFLVWTAVPLLAGPLLVFLTARITSPPPAHRTPGPESVPPQVAPVIAVGSDVFPQDPNVFPVRMHRESRNGTVTTTVTWSDQTTGTYVRRSLAGSANKFDYENFQKNSQAALRLRSAKVGESFESLIFGTEQEFIYGGQEGIYTLDSPPGTVAVHAGVLRVGESARVRLTVVPAPSRYPMLERNGIMAFPKNPLSGPGYRIEKAGDPAAAEGTP